MAAHAEDAALIKAIDTDAFATRSPAHRSARKIGEPARKRRTRSALRRQSLQAQDRRPPRYRNSRRNPAEDHRRRKPAKTSAPPPKDDLDVISANNRIRRIIGDLMGALTLMSPDRKTRLTAADALFKSRNAAALPALDQAIAAEKDAAVLKVMKEARAALVLADDSASAEARLQDLELLRIRGGEESLSLATTAATSKIPPSQAPQRQPSPPSKRASRSGASPNVWYGLSLGSVASARRHRPRDHLRRHGRHQHGARECYAGRLLYLPCPRGHSHLRPGLIEVSLLIALPVAFLVTGLMGVAIERGIIRFLYGRPLETLLATFGVSLILQQTVRSIFGPTNREVSSRRGCQAPSKWAASPSPTAASGSSSSRSPCSQAS